MFKLYINRGSGSACVEAALSELQLPFERVPVNYTDEGIDDPEFALINPRNQIPALVFDDGTCLTETLAILNYLADRHPESGLAPAPGSLARARLDRWMSFTLANIYEGELRKNYPQRYVVGDVQAVEAAAEAFVLENYRLLEAACSEGPYFFGASPTIFDFYLWMFINWFEDPEDLRSACPRLLGLADTVMHRPGIDAVHRYNFGEGLGWSPPVA